jgi:hypothetical protein
MQAVGREVVISFFGSVSANSNTTLVSKLVNVPFRVRRIRASFPPGVNRLMTLKYYISQDKSAPTTEPPQGVNILAQLGQVTFITGDDEWKDLPNEVDFIVSNGFLKVYAENSDVFEHTIDTQLVIELLPRESDSLQMNVNPTPNN